MRGAPVDGAAALPTLWTTVAPPPALHPIGLPAHAEPGTGSCGTCAWRYVGGPGRRAERCRQTMGLRVDLAWPACERYEAAASLDCLTCGACCREAYGAVEVAVRDPIRKRRPELVVERGGHLEVRRSGDRCAALEGGEIVAVGTSGAAIAADAPGASGAADAPGSSGATRAASAASAANMQSTASAASAANAANMQSTASAASAAAVSATLTTTRYRCTIYDDRPRTCRDFALGGEHCLTARQRVGLSL